MYRYTKVSLLAVALATAGTFVHAESGRRNDAAGAAPAGITLTQAITAAEQHANGRATRAELEQSRRGRVYEVEVVSGAKVFDVKVDADKGTVVSSAEDRADRDDDDDKRD